VQLALCDGDRERCASEAALKFLRIVDSGRQRDSRARLGEINRAINLAIRWKTSPNGVAPDQGRKVVRLREDRQRRVTRAFQSKGRNEGFDEVIDVMPGLLRRFPNLMIVGDGEDRGRLEEKMMSLGLESRPHAERRSRPSRLRTLRLRRLALGRS
jgi:hypothetical protein